MLAYISVIAGPRVGTAVEWGRDGRRRSLELLGVLIAGSGSTWTISSQFWTMDLIRDVLPEPIYWISDIQTVGRIVFFFIPGAPARRILNRPIAFPFSVNGRRLGILILGIINCETLTGPRFGDRPGFSSSSDPTAWLLISSVIEISSRGRSDWLDSDLGLLGREEGSSGMSGVNGRESISIDG